MGNWNDLADEIQSSGSTYDLIRRKYLAALNRITGRNVILYYSGWLQRPNAPGIAVDDGDKNGFMTVINKLDRSKGLDLILHTPGGGTAATESLVDYLHSMFGDNIRAIVPQLAMSAGTMMACACKEILMGKHSSLGPIDPQISGIPAHGIVEEFKRAVKEVKEDPATIPVWQPIIAKYTPALIGESEKSILWSQEMVKEWLREVMFKGDSEVTNKVNRILTELGDHAITKSHARHFSYDKCKEIGLKVVALEDDQKLQDAVLSVHHATMHTLSVGAVVKIIENHHGTAFIQTVS